MITRQGFDKINDELKRLIQDERPIACQMVEDTRPVGVVEDNPEYEHAIEYQDRVEKRIFDLTQIIHNCIIFEKNMCQPNKVSFGATVQFVDCDTDVMKEYTIVSIYESDISKGLISIEAPFVRSMMGTEVGETFEFNDKEYLITDINYSLLKD